MTRVGLTVAVLAAAGFFIARFYGRAGGRGVAHVKILASLPLGKDVFFVLRCGPDVFALTSGHTGVRLLGRWKYEEWTLKCGTCENNDEDG